MADSERDDLRAIVRPSTALDRFTLDRWDPSPPLHRFVDRFWKTSWNLAEPFEQPIVTFPVVNLVFQADGSAMFSGVQRNTDKRRLDGSGWALGVMFRPGGCRPFVERPMVDLVDARLPAEDVLGAGIGPLAEAVLTTDDDDRRRQVIESFLLERAPSEPTVGEELSALVERAAAADPPVTRASELAEDHGVSPRTLQRLFAEHVGPGPKMVLDRYRVQAAAELARRPVRSWADAAQQLGYADQAHLTADFSGTVGQSPAAYTRDETGGG